MSTIAPAMQTKDPKGLLMDSRSYSIFLTKAVWGHCMSALGRAKELPALCEVSLVFLLEWLFSPTSNKQIGTMAGRDFTYSCTHESSYLRLVCLHRGNSLAAENIFLMNNLWVCLLNRSLFGWVPWLSQIVHVITDEFLTLSLPNLFLCLWKCHVHEDIKQMLRDIFCTLKGNVFSQPCGNASIFYFKNAQVLK